MRIQCFFVLHTDPVICAQSYCDLHLDAALRLVDKIICTVDSEKVTAFSKNILCKWAEHDKHYAWLVAHAKALHAEMDFRFGVTSYTPIFANYREVPLAGTPKRWVQLIKPRIPGDAVTAFRNYYIKTQQKSTWTRRGAPSWWVGKEQIALELDT